MNALPIVKYDGYFWYFDDRLNELRPLKGFDLKHPEPYRLDSSGMEQEYFREIVAGTPLTVFDADGDD